MQHPSSTEPSPALLLPRRTLLALAALGGAARLARAGERAADVESPARTLERFLELAVPRLRELVGDTSSSGQERYLHTLAAFAAGLREVPLPEMRETTKDSPGRTFLGAHECDAPFSVLHWRLEPGARIGLHPH